MDVRLIDWDPELFEGLDPQSARAAGAHTAARVVHLPRGPLDIDDERLSRNAEFGLLVLEGVLARGIMLGDRTGVELLGPGDVLRPWARLGRHVAISLEENWQVTDGAMLALLGQPFARALERWPQLAATLMDRMVFRAHSLAFHVAVCRIRRIETRLHVVFWYFGDRWGRVTPHGVVLPARFTHRLLANVVAAQRASVSRALQALRRRGLVERLPDGYWLLRGDPPQELTSAFDARLA